MSFGRFPGFDGDPFFSRTMPSFPSFQPFPMFGFPAIEPQGGSLHRRSQGDRQLGLMDPFSMFNNMERMMNAAGGGPGNGPGNGHYYSSSSVMHFSNTGGSEPQMYRATSSVTSGPGGVKETRKSECDSQSGMKKMAIGHHIGERSHTIEKRENVRTKDREQHQEFINLDETEASDFSQEWRRKTGSLRFQPGLQSDNYADRRGLGGVPEVSRPSNSLRDHRSRSPEKRKQRAGDSHHHHHHHHLPSVDPETERRQEYLKQRGDKNRDRKVRF